jgi:transposase-like protein
VKSAAWSGHWSPSRSAFAGFRFPAEVIRVAVCWCLRSGLCYRGVEDLLAERGVGVDHVTVYRRVQRFTPLLADAARSARHAPGDRWFVEETHVQVNCRWRCVYRAIDQHGQIIDVPLSARRDAAAAPRFFTRALRTLRVVPTEVVTDAAPAHPGVPEELTPAAWQHVAQYANNPIEADHGQLERWLRAMRGPPTDRRAQDRKPPGPHQTIPNPHAGQRQNLRTAPADGSGLAPGCPTRGLRAGLVLGRWWPARDGQATGRRR